MSNKSSAGCDTENECDYYSVCWEESSYKDLVDSDSENDLCLHLLQNFSRSSLEIEKEKSKLSEIVLLLENNPASFTDCSKSCPLLRAQKLKSTRDFQVELSPESVLHFTFKDDQSSDYLLKVYSYDGSCQDALCTSSGIPHLIITQKSVKESTPHTVKKAHELDKVYHKQKSAGSLLTSSHKKSVQVSFPCTETEALENITCERSKQSVLPTEVNETLVKEPVIFQRHHESICNKNKTSTQLITEHLDYASGTLDKSDDPETPECICSCVSSGDLIISLTLESSYLSDSLVGDITSSDVKVGKEDSGRRALAFKCKGPEHNQLFKKLHISIIPNSVHLSTETLKQTTPFTKEAGLQQILVDEASQPVSTRTESSESSSPDTYPDHVPATLKPWASSQFFLSSTHKPVTQYPYFFVRSLPHNRITSTEKTSEVWKNQQKVFRPVKSIVFPKNKVHKDQTFRKQSCRSSQCHRRMTWDVESVSPNTRHYKREEELEINELYYLPQTQISACRCSPLLDLSVNLNSERRYSGTEKLLGINRRLHKRTGRSKVMPRFSSQCLLNPRSSFERFHYISPTRKKNNLKMQNIWNYCVGGSGEQNRHESCKEEVCPIVNCSCRRRNGIFTSDFSRDVRSTAPVLSNSRNGPVPLPCVASVLDERRRSPVPCLQRSTPSPATLHSLPNERWQSPASCLQTERDTYPVALYSLPNERRHSPAPCLQTKRENWHYPDGKCCASHSPCANIVNVVQPLKERNMFNIEEVNSEAAQEACGDLALKKLLVCPCGNMPQHGLFPDGDISQSVSTKIRNSPDINQRTRMTTSNAVNNHRGTSNTMETCCSKCHHLSPCSSLYNIRRQETLRNQFTKAQSYFEDGFPMKKVKEDSVHKSKAIKTNERTNVRIHAGPATSQQIGPSSPSNHGYSVSKCAVYEPKYHSCYPTVVQQHHGTSRDLPTSFSSKHKLLENCLNRRQVFLEEPCKGIGTRCTCSQEIPLFCLDQTDLHGINRTAPPKRMDSENAQDSPQIHHGWERHNISHQCCCRDKVQYSRLQ